MEKKLMKEVWQAAKRMAKARREFESAMKKRSKPFLMPPFEQKTTQHENQSNE